MNLLAIISNLRFQDILDILFLTFVAYYLFAWFQGTKAFKAIVGLLILGVVFTIAETWGLFLTTWVFQFLWQILVILIVVLFQSEIRQVLEKVNPLQRLGLRRHTEAGEWVTEFVKGIFALAEKRTGALVIIERSEKVQEHVTAGQDLETRPTPEVLKSIFQKESPLHDGAIVIKDGRIVEVACYLPLSSDEGLPVEWGTRHRAALGLSERCDAWVVVVSEERGQVSMAEGGRMTAVKTPQQLYQIMREALTLTRPEHRGWKDALRLFLVHRWRAKMITFFLVSTVWLTLAGQQNFEVKLRIPVVTRNLPSKLEIVQPQDAHVEITVRGLRKDASTLAKENVVAELDLSHVYPGKRRFAITRNLIQLPDDGLQLVDIKPQEVDFTFQNKPEAETLPDRNAD
ncbi:MAG: diadenylate cyclase CdaA [Deltaproteobacteria bacterium]|nr:diadenylate cyclase CdaA [Deltaproteobacteria bacterium]